jgi:hypothetical protein
MSQSVDTWTAQNQQRWAQEDTTAAIRALQLHSHTVPVPTQEPKEIKYVNPNEQFTWDLTPTATSDSYSVGYYILLVAVVLYVINGIYKIK